MRQIKIDPHALHESALWHARQAGTPNLIIAAANEKKVRYYIEAGFPPLQLYATTGQNWQVALLRHEPLGNTCSLCLFPADEIAAPTACATGRAKPGPADGDDQVDAALPFLSFAAGLMTAAEGVKRVQPGFPFNADRVILSTRHRPQLMSARLSHREGCFCETRDPDIYRRMVIRP